jgi:hypothetical protein
MIMEVGMQAVGQCLVFAGVADEDGIVLNRQHRRRAPSIDLLIGQANAAQEMQLTAILGQLKRRQVDSRWTTMIDLC